MSAVLFDLDGTLLDTASDMARALNRVRQEQDLPVLPVAQVRPWVSHGTRGLLRVGFDLAPDHPRAGPLRERILHHYAADLASDTRLFDGMEELLSAIEADGDAGWGIVTNKPSAYTLPLLRQLDLLQRCPVVVCADQVARRKPEPDALYRACELLDIPPGDCLYVGDAERDISAGRRAGMRTLVAGYGYLGVDDDPRSWGADGIINSPLEILNCEF